MPCRKGKTLRAVVIILTDTLNSARSEGNGPPGAPWDRPAGTGPTPRGPSGRSASPGRIQKDVGCAFLGLDDEQLRQAQQRDPDLVAVEAALREEKCFVSDVQLTFLRMKIFVGEKSRQEEASHSQRCGANKGDEIDAFASFGRRAWWWWRARLRRCQGAPRGTAGCLSRARFTCLCWDIQR
ncbi:unnamed protein product [Lampetra fluviatilis]